MNELTQMQIGQIVDFCIDYNEREKKATEKSEKQKTNPKRKATQADIDAFFG